ncbi:MAG: hypothetical protein CL760_11460 [Chloroflexi bacterium]|nr:hypothetical protein [Chloroflexota bacterium]|tara:strand:+ start:7687 stop:7977 length:291 start_codon:yes stop_codon:yes gene_type:complete
MNNNKNNISFLKEQITQIKNPAFKKLHIDIEEREYLAHQIVWEMKFNSNKSLRIITNQHGFTLEELSEDKTILSKKYFNNKYSQLKDIAKSIVDFY